MLHGGQGITGWNKSGALRGGALGRDPDTSPLWAGCLGSRSTGPGLWASQGRSNKVPQTGRLKPQKRTLSQFWRLDIQSQGAMGAVLCPGRWAHPSMLPALVVASTLHSCLTPRLWGHVPSLSVFSPHVSLFIRTPVTVG